MGEVRLDTSVTAVSPAIAKVVIIQQSRRAFMRKATTAGLSAGIIP
ncbi:twin-arginine translocation signal domain-containing protein [Rahnella sp. ChDrAdgB13]